jgi:hypothetical protein
MGCAGTPNTGGVAELESADKMIMVVIDDPRSERRKRGISGFGYSARLDYQDDPLLHHSAAAIADDHGLSIQAEWPLRNLNVHCFAVVQPSDDVLNALQNDKRVRWVQPFNNFTMQTSDTRAATNESLINEFFNNINERGNNVKIAVIDTSVDTSHPDLTRSRITQANFAGKRGLPSKEIHGTAVVGLIAAKPGSPEGLSGLANEANVHLFRGCWQDTNGKGICNTLTLALAFDATIDLQPDILNLSLTGPDDKVLNELLAILLKKNTLVVAAYDENRTLKERFPLQQPGVVYAYGIEGESNHPVAENILYAPRHAISLTPINGYDLISGHSIATPRITAMAARLISRHPDATRQQILAGLKQWLNTNNTAM